MQTAVWPTGLLLVLAAALAAPSWGEDELSAAGFVDRVRIVMAALLQALGGRFELRQSASSPFGSGAAEFGEGSVSFALAPLTVTVLWIGVLYLGARRLRRRGEGLEAALRVSLLLAGAVLVLALAAQPQTAGIAVSSSPPLAASGALLISLAVTGGVLQRTTLAGLPALSPAVLMAVRALGTAVRTFGVVLALCTLAGLITYAVAVAASDDGEPAAVLVLLPFLPNLGVMVLGLSWGVPVEYDVQGQFRQFGSGGEHRSVGLPQIGDELGAGAVAGVLALGVVCALVFGIRAVRRSTDRREQLVAAGAFLGLYAVLVRASGAALEVAGDYGLISGSGTTEAGLNAGKALLSGLLWVAGALLVAPALLRLTGRPPAGQPPAGGAATGARSAPSVGTVDGTAGGVFGAPPGTSGVRPAEPQAKPWTQAQAGPWEPSGYQPTLSVPPAPGAFGPPPAPEVSPYAQTQSALSWAPHPAPAGARDPDQAAAARRRRVRVWAGVVTGALLIGGGATAAVLLLADDGRGTATVDGRTAPAPSRRSVSPPAALPALPTPPAEPTAGPPSPSDLPALPDPADTPGNDAPRVLDPVPAGFELRDDTSGFTVAVPAGWVRRQEGTQTFYTEPASGTYLQVGVIRNTPASSYDNFLGLERTAGQQPGSHYQRLQLNRSTFQGRPGALWEFLHVAKPGTSAALSHVIDQAFVTDEGTEYAILFTSRASDWDARQHVFRTALTTFRPR